MMASHSNLVTSIKVNSATPPPVVRMRSRDDMRFNNNKSSKKINRLSRKILKFLAYHQSCCMNRSFFFSIWPHLKKKIIETFDSID